MAERSGITEIGYRGDDTVKSVPHQLFEDGPSLAQFAMSFIGPRTVQVACIHDLFTHIAEGAVNAKEISVRTKLPIHVADRLLIVCASLGLLNTDSGKYRNTPVVEKFLVRSSPHYMGSIFHMASHSFKAFAELEKVAATGKPISPAPQYREDHVVRDFVNTSWGMSKAQAINLLKTLPMTGDEHILDLGAGSAVYAVTFCQLYPNLQAVVFDFPQVLRHAEKFILEYGVSDRIIRRPGDVFIDYLGDVYDVAILASFIHGFSLEGVSEILRKVYASLQEGGRVVLQDHFLNDQRTGPPMAAMFGLNIMLHNEGGTTHSVSSIIQTLEKSGFKNPQVLNQGGSGLMPILVATK